MWIGWIEFDILLGDVQSLKEKRSVIRPLLAELKRRFDVSVAEVGDHDQYRRSQVGAGLVAADRAGTLAGIDTSGNVWARRADGTWTKGGQVSGTPQALAVDGNRLFVADDRGISVTDDAGATWTALSAHS